MCTLLILALVLSSICVWTYVRRNMTDVIVDKYEFMNEKMGIALDNLYRKTDAVTAEIILENDVQKSLKNKELQEVDTDIDIMKVSFAELERCENADRYDIPSVADIEDLMFMIED